MSAIKQRLVLAHWMIHQLGFSDYEEGFTILNEAPSGGVDIEKPAGRSCIQRIFEACRNAGTPAPILDYQPNDLWIEFPFSAVYLETIRGESTEKATKKAAQATAVTPQVTPQVTAPVSDYVEKLLHLLRQREPLGNEDVRLAFSLKSRRRLRETYLAPAMASGLIEYTIPEKPNSRLQKYRLTEKGRALLD